jgi:hypothetical protein
MVERHRLDAEPVGQAAHAERLETFLVGQGDRAEGDALDRERRPSGTAATARHRLFV